MPCHPELTGIGTKSLTKSGAKLTREEVDTILYKGFDNQVLKDILESDISDVVDYLRRYIGTKSIVLIDLLGTGPKNRSELLAGIGLYNKTDNFNKYIKPLIEIGVIEMTIPDKPS
ncbi:MAG: Fic family protein [Mangrovibacterium sp.]